MRLRNIYIAGQEGLKDLCLLGHRIAAVADPSLAGSSPADEVSLSFEGALALPGLINSHDHLDFDLFPQFKSQTYSSYKEWGSDIHGRYGESIAAVLRVPRELRIRWGLYKNLLGGVTSVVHHGVRLDIPEDLISVFQDAESLHSVSGEKRWRRKLLSPFRRERPLVIHTGEGTTPECSGEIDSLIRWNILGRPLIGIHAIAMSGQQAAAFRALVWCPDSNYFLYDRTADIPLLRDRTKVVFGTDSTLTASWNIWEQLRLARKLKMVEDSALWDMVTAGPARLWELADRGTIGEGQTADLVIAERPAGSVGWDAVFGLDPASILLVLHQGNIRLFDVSLREQLKDCGYSFENFYPVVVDGRIKYVLGDLPGLLREIYQHYPGALFPVTTL
jgi:hypothetical protein